MRAVMSVAAICGWLCVAQVAFAETPLPAGTWEFNGGGYEHKLVLKVGKDNKVTGTVYDDPISGSYDPATGRLNFVRMCNPKDPSTFQVHKGYVFVNEDGKLKRYTLAGTFFNIGDMGQSGWYAQILVGDIPVSGKNTPGVEVLDALMLKSLKGIGCTGATLTITRGKETLYSRGYGWSDRERKVPIKPDTPMGIASCEKPMLAAAIRQLARDGKLDLNASIFKVLKIKPVGKVVDKRVWDITINNVINHKAGWQGKPADQARKAYEAIRGQEGVPGPDSLRSYEKILEFVMVQKLSFKPGEREEYDNFGYAMLALLLTRTSGKSTPAYFREDLCRPYGVKELKWVGNGTRRKGEPPQLWNGLVMTDPEGYRMSVSTPALCTFMRCFWYDGEPRDDSSQLWIKTGGWDNCTSAMIWRPDGINVAWAFNGRGGAPDPGEELWKKAIDKLIKDKLIKVK